MGTFLLNSGVSLVIEWLAPMSWEIHNTMKSTAVEMLRRLSLITAYHQVDSVPVGLPQVRESGNHGRHHEQPG
jgi:hypothetical protein